MLAWKDGNNQWRVWHINEPPPDFDEAVVNLQVDGDELNYLLTCMEQVGFDKMRGFLHVNVPRCPVCQTPRMSCSQGHVWKIPKR